jgi:hypothetical protein
VLRSATLADANPTVLVLATAIGLAPLVQFLGSPAREDTLRKGEVGPAMRGWRFALGRS